MDKARWVLLVWDIHPRANGIADDPSVHNFSIIGLELPYLAELLQLIEPLEFETGELPALECE